MADFRYETQLPELIRAGEPVVMRLGITVDRSSRRPRIRGWVKLDAHPGGPQSTEGNPVDWGFRDDFEVEGTEHLPAGTTWFERRCVLPADAPPTHVTGSAFVAAQVAIVVGGSFLGGEEMFLARPMCRPALVMQPVERAPMSAEVRGANLTARLSLASTRLIAGEDFPIMLELDAPRVRRTSIVLRWRSILTTTTPSLTRFSAFSPLTLQLAAGTGRRVQLPLRCPATMTPTFTTTLHGRSWELQLLVDGVSLEVPIEIVDASAQAVTAPLRLDPAQAETSRSARLNGIAATHGWRAVEASPRERGAIDVAACEADIAGTHAEVAWRLDDSGELVTTVQFPPLGLGLRAAASAGLRELLGGDLPVADAAWRATHTSRATDPARATPLLDALIPSLGAAALGRLETFTDDELRWRRPVDLDETSEPGEFAATMTAVAAVAHALAAARARLPPPADLDLDVAAWAALADELGGTACLGAPSITVGTASAGLQLVVTRTRGRPAHVRLVLARGPGGDGAPARPSFTLARPADAGATPAAAALAHRLAGWPDDLVDLALAHDHVAASWTLPTDPRPLLDVARVRDLLTRLRDLVSDGTAGPYR